MEFTPRHFLRCHSKTDKDSADVSTQVTNVMLTELRKIPFT